MEEENINVENEQKSYFNKVTPLSKYLAMALFVILPFLGGWIGYTYAPEKVVEVERVVFQEIEVATNKEAATGDGHIDLNRFVDDEVGISFDYPSAWGEIIVSNDDATNAVPENGDENSLTCSQKYPHDPCNTRAYEFSNTNIRFLTAASERRREYIYPRGGWWGDDAYGNHGDYISECEADSDCVLYKNGNNIEFAKETDEYNWWGVEYPTSSMYALHNPNSRYYGLQFSSVELPDVEGYREIFETTVIDSFQFIDSLYYIENTAN